MMRGYAQAYVDVLDIGAAQADVLRKTSPIRVVIKKSDTSPLISAFAIGSRLGDWQRFAHSLRGKFSAALLHTRR